MDNLWLPALLAIVIFGTICEDKITSDSELDRAKLMIECTQIPECNWDELNPALEEN